MKKTNVQRIISTVSALLLGAGIVFAAGQADTSAAAKTVSSSAKEAPSLTALVKAGKLPPLDQRVPPAGEAMVSPMEKPGVYGGTMRLTSYGGDSKWKVGKLTEEPLFRFKLDGTIEPNVAKGYDISPDGKVYTIYLRKGMKWSDGVPFTSDDVVFYYNDMCVPKTFGKSLYNCFFSTDPVTGKKEPCTVEAVDKYTVKVSFKHTNATFLEALANDAKWFFAPKHYYEKILPAFIGEEAAKAKAKELGYSDVKAMGKNTGYYYWPIVGRPTLRAWIAKNDIEDGIFTMERNPYYWKVDKDGRQLPYIDTLSFVKVSDYSQELLKVMAKEVDFGALNLADFTVLKENERIGDYKVCAWGTTAWAERSTTVHFNQTIKDPKYRKLFQNINFRQAMSISVDRKEIAELVMDGLTEPSQSAVQEGMLGYDKKWTEQWAEYDVKKAEKLLDGCGIKRNGAGKRVFSDGTPVVLELQLTELEDIRQCERTAELLSKFWGALGIGTTVKTYSRDLMTEKINANDHTVLVGPMNGIVTFNPALRSNTVVPTQNYAPWAGAYGEWYATSGKSGVEPPAEVKALMDIYDKIKGATNVADVEKGALDIINIHKKYQWEIGFCRSAPKLVIKANRLQNIPDNLIWCEEYRDLGIAHVENAWIKTGK